MSDERKMEDEWQEAEMGIRVEILTAHMFTLQLRVAITRQERCKCGSVHAQLAMKRPENEKGT